MHGYHKYERLECIGDGAFGPVLKGRDKLTGEFVAMKQVNFRDGIGVPSTILRELSLLMLLKHENIIGIIDTIYKRDNMFIIMEYMDHSLTDYLSCNLDSVDLSVCQNVIFQIFKGVNYCHGMNVFHRDLKPQNILINKGIKVKISDFGLSRIYNSPCATYSNEIVTLWYRAPDLLLGSAEYDFRVDIWSIGCIFAEILSSGIPLFCGNNVTEQLECIYKTLGVPTEESWPGVSNLPFYKYEVDIIVNNPLEVVFPSINFETLSLLSRLLCMDPNQRIHLEEAMKHPFFEVIPHPVGVPST